MRRRVAETAGVAAFALLTGALAPTAAAGQACLGVPQGSNGALVGGAGFPDDATTYAMGGMTKAADSPIYFAGSFGLIVPDEDDVTENGKSLSGSMAYEVESLAPGASVCPTIAARHSWIGADNLWSIPFGAAVGSTVRLGRSGSAALTPWVSPHFLYIRRSVDDVDNSADSDVFMRIAAGATLNVGSFMVGGRLARILEDEFETVFSVMVGAAWR